MHTYTLLRKHTVHSCVPGLTHNGCKAGACILVPYMAVMAANCMLLMTAETHCILPNLGTALPFDSDAQTWSPLNSFTAGCEIMSNLRV